MGEKIQQILQFTTSLKENKKYSCTYKNSYKLHQIFLVFVWLPNNQEKKKSQNKASIFFFFFWPHHVACGILVSQPGIEPVSSALEAGES